MSGSLAYRFGDNRMRLMGKVALVTGAAQGIGAAIARRFVEEGAEVFLSDVNAIAGEALVAELAGLGDRARFVRLDVTSEQDWIAVFSRVTEAFGRLDVLVSNAGLNIRRPIEEMSESDLDTMIAVNVKGPFLGMMSSICGLIGHRFTPEAYTMVKGALTALARSIAVRYAKDGIRCNSVHPSTVETAQVRELLRDPMRRAERLNEVPLGRLASVEDVANAFVYLASEEAAFLNGVALPIDGGLTAS
jgi:cyclopentanol dehydrogenase